MALRAACTPRGDVSPPGAQPLLRVLELAASKAAKATAFDPLGARLLKEAEAEEERAAAAREKGLGCARRAGKKLLQLKSQRAQAESKLLE